MPHDAAFHAPDSWAPPPSQEVCTSILAGVLAMVSCFVMELNWRQRWSSCSLWPQKQTTIFILVAAIVFGCIHLTRYEPSQRYTSVRSRVGDSEVVESIISGQLHVMENGYESFGVGFLVAVALCCLLEEPARSSWRHLICESIRRKLCLAQTVLIDRHVPPQMDGKLHNPTQSSPPALTLVAIGTSVNDKWAERAVAARLEAEAISDRVAACLIAQEAAEKTEAKCKATRLVRSTRAKLAPRLPAVPTRAAAPAAAPPPQAAERLHDPLPIASHSAVVAASGPGVATRVQAAYGWPCALLGSSHFFDGRDVDLVLTVDRCTSLADAYTQVVAATGWQIVGDDAISGQRVVCLHGVFDGCVIDAQVWRGESLADTLSERLTCAALRHTAKLLDGTCARCRQSLCLLHGWAEVAGVKAGRLGMPPGIAWTIAGTMLWQLTADWDERTDERRLEALLRALVSVLRTEGSPCIALGCPVRFTNASGPCDEPLCILLDEINVCERMTLKTTRALLVIVEGGLRLPAAQRLLPESYQRLLSARLPIATAARPRAVDVIPRTLHHILAGLDAYEPIYALMATTDPVTTDVRLHAILDPSASAVKYGLHPARHQLVGIGCGPTGMNWVRLGYSARSHVGEAILAPTTRTRVWSVWAHAEAPAGARVVPWLDAVARCSAGAGARGVPKAWTEGDANMALWWKFDAPSGCLFVPNAAHLTVDLSSRFEPSSWLVAGRD